MRLLLAAVCVLLASCSGKPPESDPSNQPLMHEERVSRADFGAEWPLTVEGGRLQCIRPSFVVINVDGTIYALNGKARGKGRQDNPQWKDGSDITIKGDLDVPKNTMPLIQRGLALCD